MIFVTSAGYLLLPAGLILIALVRRGDQRRGRLAKRTLAVVGLLYLAYLMFVVTSGRWGIFPLPLAGWVGWDLGMLVLVMGAGLAGVGVIAFLSFDLMSGRAADELVTSVGCRLSRNPQNVGWGLATRGMALIRGSGLALIQVAIFWILFWAYLPVEEADRERIYGGVTRRTAAEVTRMMGFPGGMAQAGGFSHD